MTHICWGREWTNADRNKQICSDKTPWYESWGGQHNHYAAAVSQRKAQSIIRCSKWHCYFHHIHFRLNADLTNQVMIMSPFHGGTVDFHAVYESTRGILFPTCWLLIDWLGVIQRQATLELVKVSHWKSCVQGSIPFDTSRQVLSIIHQTSTVLHFSPWQTLTSAPSKSHCLQPMSLTITIWRNTFVTHRPPLDANKHDWYKDEDSGSLAPKIAPFNSLQAPDEMLKLIKRSYEQQWAAMYIT